MTEHSPLTTDAPGTGTPVRDACRYGV